MLKWATGVLAAGAGGELLTWVGIVAAVALNGLQTVALLSE